MDTRFNYRLLAALAKRDVKQKDLAAAIGTQPNAISYLCSGARRPNLNQLVSISKALNVSTDFLLGLTEVMETSSDKRAISDYTGLSENAIDYLHLEKNDRETMSAINTMFDLDIEDLHRLAVCMHLFFSRRPLKSGIVPTLGSLFSSEEEKRVFFGAIEECGGILLQEREALDYYEQQCAYCFRRLISDARQKHNQEGE